MGRSPDPAGARPGRKAVVTVVVACILAVGAIGLVGSIADFDELLDAVRQANKAWFPLCLGGLVLAYAGYILGYRDVARVDGGPELDYWTITRVVAAGFGANVVGSSAGTIAVDFWALHRAGAGVYEAARRVLGLNTLEWAVLGGFAAVAGGLSLAGVGPRGPIWMALVWLVVVPSLIAAALWFSSPGRADLILRRLPDKLRKGLADGIGAVVVVRKIAGHPHSYPAGVVGFPLYWAGHLLTLYGAARAFTGEHVSLVALVLAFATGYAATSLPLPAGGSGAIEAAMAFSLHAFGIALAPSFLAVLVYRLFTFWIPIVPALLLLPAERHLADDLPRARREDRAGARV
jgi:uncharacterized membrane protein YbhN (UPF0104 family)